MEALSISHLSLARFRSYQSGDIHLDPRPVVVVGENGSGKTNLLEALSMLSPGRGLRRALANELPAFGSADWRVAANLRGRTEAHEIITKSDGRRRSVELNGKASSQTALASVLRVLWLTPAMDRLWVDTPAERRRFLDRLTMSLVPEHAEATIRYERALKERNRLLRDGARDNAWYLALEEQMATHGVLVVAYRRKIIARLREVQAYHMFPEVALALASQVPDDPDAFAEALARGRARDIAAGRSLLGPHRDDLLATHVAKGVPAHFCSTGEQKTLLLSVTLASVQAVGEDFGAMPLLLLDEVASHLDAQRRQDLIEALHALKVQAWLTGTDALLFADFAERAQWLVIEDDGAAAGAGSSVRELNAGRAVV